MPRSSPHVAAVRYLKVATTLEATIPSSATEIASTGEGVELDGNCADTEFLMPNAQWNAYVAQYFTAGALRPRYGC
ncbi:hypothetical protein DFR67_103448 [Williamsia limnetica]|uniref:Uncharacterized protein n=1 Tax=Williamsia limnetica TaxID=882452 RepID=A0A318S009_WILLI|nr:hypothetical protein [Williamsia limnetica]PYE19535.1 hypothetical protein DFR67_103448 [Williamsia limnetica]